MSEVYSESQLCKDFTHWISDLGWTAYPETGGWDILLSAGDDPKRLVNTTEEGFKKGSQVGVQAKLQGNLQVLAQCLAQSGAPVALVGRASEDFVAVARHIGICVVAQEKQVRVFGRKKWAANSISPFHIIGYVQGNWTPHHELPPVVPDLPAGGRSPRQLTEWRIKALKMAKKLMTGQEVTNLTFKELKLFRRRWLDNKWASIIDPIVAPYKYAAGPRIREVLRGYEVVYDQLDKAGEL